MPSQPIPVTRRPADGAGTPLHGYASVAPRSVALGDLWDAIVPRAVLGARRLMPPGADPALLARDHEAAWARLQTGLQDWQKARPSGMLNCGVKTFVAAWFCPQVASALTDLLDQKVTLLCTGVPIWLSEFQVKGLCLDIRSDDAPANLQRTLGTGAPLAGMLDRVYMRSEALQVRFGSGSIKVPKRIIDALVAAKYELHVPVVVGDSLQNGDRLATEQRSSEDVAQWYADQVYRRVMQKTSDWLTLYSL